MTYEEHESYVKRTSTLINEWRAANDKLTNDIDVRRHEDLCGHDAKWFAPKEVPCS
jgi:hypothetical protein